MAFNFYYNLTSGQRKGILALCLLIVGIQVGYYFISNADLSTPAEKSAEEKAAELKVQTQVAEYKAVSTSGEGPDISTTSVDVTA